MKGNMKSDIKVDGSMEMKRWGGGERYTKRVWIRRDKIREGKGKDEELY